MRVHFLSPRQGDDRGAVAVLVVILLTVLMAMAAVAVDVSSAWAMKRKLSVAADGAALAAAGAIGNSMPLGMACPDGLALASAAGQQAAATANQGTAPGSTMTQYTATCAADGSYVEVTVANQQTVPSIFAGIFSLLGSSDTTLTPARQATARVGPPKAVSGLRPYAVCTSVILGTTGYPDVTKAYAVSLSNENPDKSAQCTGTQPGQWGTVDFTPTGGGTNETVDWTVSGYPGYVTLPGQIGVDTGNPPSQVAMDSSALPYLVSSGEVVAFPVVSGCGNCSGGSKGTFYGTGFVNAQVCAYRIGAKYSDPEQSKCSDTNGVTTEIAAYAATKNNIDYLIIQPTKYTGSSYLGFSGCSIGSSCDLGARGVQLYR